MKITDKNGVVYQLVPMKSTKEMCDKALSDDLWYEINPPPHIAYELMLSAAPEPELPEGLEVVAWVNHPEDVKALYSETEVRPTRSLPLVLQSSALAALAKKETQLAKHEEESGRVIAWQLKTIERRAALIEKCQAGLKDCVRAIDGEGFSPPDTAEEAIAAIDEHQNHFRDATEKESNP